MPDTEIELKLAVRPEDLPRLRSAKALGPANGKAAPKALESTYFDTPDLRLAAAGLSLRVRKVGRSFIQTLKSAPEGGTAALVRGEWEGPVPGPTPDLSALPEAAPREALAGLVEAGLKPVFTSDVKRTLRVTSVGASQVELALDVGEIRTPEGATLPVSELELELKSGTDPVALYDLALALHGEVPMRLETRTKSARGYALAAGTGPTWAKAGKLEISPADTVEQALAAIVRHCLGHMLANEAVALAGEQPEGIHQMRVALRRLRSAFSLFKGLIPADQAATLGPEVKWLADSFGPARDWDVFLESLLAPVEEAFPADPGLSALRQAALRCRHEGYEEAKAAIQSPRYTTLLLKLGAWVDGRGWRDQPVSEGSARLLQPILDLSGSLLDKRHKQGRKRGRHFARLDPEARHQLRIALKKLRYAAEFFRGLYDPKPVKRYLEDLAGLQEALGHLQDVATVEKLVGQVRDRLGAEAPLGWEQGAGLVMGWHGRGLRDQEPAIVRDWEAFADTKPFWKGPKDKDFDPVI